MFLSPQSDSTRDILLSLLYFEHAPIVSNPIIILLLLFVYLKLDWLSWSRCTFRNQWRLTNQCGNLRYSLQSALANCWKGRWTHLVLLQWITSLKRLDEESGGNLPNSGTLISVNREQTILPYRFLLADGLLMRLELLVVQVLLISDLGCLAI